MSNERDNFKAGLLVLVGIGLAMLLVFLLADIDQLFEEKQQVRVYYQLSDGLKGLKPGAEATLGDQPIGTVLEIHDVAEGDRVVGKEAVIELPKRVKLYENAAIELVVPPLGSGTKLNIHSVGTGQPYNQSKAIPGMLAESDLTGALVKQAGIEQEQRQQIKQIIANVAALTETLKNDMPQITASIRQVLDQTSPIVADMGKAVAQVREATSDIKAMTGEYRQRSSAWVGRIDSITQNMDEATGSVNQLVKDKGATIGESLDNVKAVTAHVKQQTLAEIDGAIVKARSAINNLHTATDQLKTLSIGQRPVLERALANAQITTGQLKLAAIEVRRSPWRLMYKPDDKELETDNLYDAARSFALAAGSLDAAAQSLRAVSDGQGASTETLGKMVTQLEALFAKFHEAERVFFNALKSSSGGAAAGSGAK